MPNADKSLGTQGAYAACAEFALLNTTLTDGSISFRYQTRASDSSITHAKVDDVFVQFALRSRAHRRDGATEALSTFAMHLCRVERFSVGLDDTAAKLRLLGARLVAIWHEDRIVDDRDRWRVISNPQPQDLASFIASQLAKAVK
jgi:hypothetical protein